LDRESDLVVPEVRPDLLRSVTAYQRDDNRADVAYVTSEADERKGEQREGPPGMAGR